MKHNSQYHALRSTLATASFSVIITDSSNNALSQVAKQAVKQGYQQNGPLSQKWYSPQRLPQC